MRVSRIYTASELLCGELVELDEKASHHLSKVLRQKAGDSLILFNGNGQQYTASIESIGKKLISARVHDASSPLTESPLYTHLGIGMSKGDRMEWVLQKATELGVTAITPLVTERAELRLKADRLEKKMEHWQQVIISACEQCGRNMLPLLYSPMAIDEWTTAVDAKCKLVLHHRSDGGLSRDKPVDSVALLVGPEGGLSENEIHAAETKGFMALTLGPRVLRTETAPLAALAILQSLWGDC